VKQKTLKHKKKGLRRVTKKGQGRGVGKSFEVIMEGRTKRKKHNWKKKVH